MGMSNVTKSGVIYWNFMSEKILTFLHNCVDTDWRYFHTHNQVYDS